MNKLSEQVSDLIKTNLLNKVGENLKLICIFGTGNNKLDSLSDVDFFIILKNMNVIDLKKVAYVREKAKEEFNIQVDIHTYSLAEFESSINLKRTFFFFNGWALYAIFNGYQKIIYSSKDINLNHKISIDSIKIGALRRANHYINRLRQLFHSNTILVRGEAKTMNNKEFLKICTSGLKCILIFLLANKSVFSFSLQETLDKSKKYFTIDKIEKAISLRKFQNFDIDVLSEAYEQAESIYQLELLKLN